MNRKIVKRIALLTALCTLESTVGVVGMNLELPATVAPGKVYAEGLSAEEAALRKAEQELIEAQYRVIAAQRALLEKQARKIKGSDTREPESAKVSAPVRESVREKVRPEPKRVEQQPVQQRPERTTSQPRTVQKQEVERPRQPVAQMPEKTSVSAPVLRNEGAGNQGRVSDEENFTNALWRENNGGVVKYKAPVFE